MGVDLSSDRCVVAARLSHDQDGSTSIELQVEMGDNHATDRRWNIVGHAIDNSVSGSVNPMERPGLGQWLTDAALQKFEILLFARLDRASRETLDMLILMRLLDNAGKRLVILDPPFDSVTATETDRSMLVIRTEMNRMQRV